MKTEFKNKDPSHKKGLCDKEKLLFEDGGYNAH